MSYSTKSKCTYTKICTYECCKWPLVRLWSYLLNPKNPAISPNSPKRILPGQFCRIQCSLEYTRLSTGLLDLLFLSRWHRIMLWAPVGCYKLLFFYTFVEMTLLCKLQFWWSAPWTSSPLTSKNSCAIWVICRQTKLKFLQWVNYNILCIFCELCYVVVLASSFLEKNKDCQYRHASDFYYDRNPVLPS